MELTSDFTLFAESVIKDETQKISLINIFDKIEAPIVPTIQAKIVVIFAFKIKHGKSSTKTKPINLYAYSPDGVKFIEFEMPYKFDPEVDQGRIAADLSGMPITQYGDYKFVLGYSPSEVIASRVLNISPVTKKVA